VSEYTVYVTPSALYQIKDLPGHIRQRIKRAIDALVNDPHPSDSKALNVPEDLIYEVWRLRLDKWRVLYTITEEDKVIDILAVRKRPPYDYRDLEKLLADIE
jgi:mRNA interferase RelE/StbE